MDIKQDTWVWVVVQDPDGEEKILGQHDDEKDISFIPAFLDKEEAQKCLGHLAKENGKKHEVQTIQYGFLVRHSTENGFIIFILNGEGDVLEKVDSSGLSITEGNIN
ncbi:hypothetical protein ACFL7M_07280 [Thermodesulfobacteriota bacterium]